MLIPILYHLALGLLIAPRVDADAARYKQVYTLARELEKSLSCEPLADGEAAPSLNAVGQRGYARVAGLYAVLAMKTENFTWAQDFVDNAVTNYERAFACDPGHMNADLLTAALDLVADVEARVEASQTVTADDPLWVQLRTHSEALQRQLNAYPPPAPIDDRERAPDPKPQVVEAARATRPVFSYFSLQLRIGAGKATLWSDEPKRQQPSLGLHLNLSAGARFVAGKRDRHSFGLGFSWGVLSEEFKSFSSKRRYALHRVGGYLRYGVYLAPRWLSLHAEGGIGLLGTFADFYLSAGGLLCTWGEALCLHGEGFAGADLMRQVKNDTAGGWTFAFAVDPMRIAQNIRERRARPPSTSSH